MLKRLAAILFIFAVAGQVSAGVCGCLESGLEHQHSCCRHERSDRDTLRGKGCCDSDCAMTQSEKLPQDRASADIKLTLKAVAEPATLKLENYAPITIVSLAPFIASIDHRLKYSRPPELYVRHHAFLI